MCWFSDQHRTFNPKQRKNMETKKAYISPIIEIIFLDNEISLALQSTPPDGPGEISGLNLLENNMLNQSAFKV